jgi:hypothetical protein
VQQQAFVEVFEQAVLFNQRAKFRGVRAEAIVEYQK